MKKYVPSLIAILTAAATAAIPLVQDLIATHPRLAAFAALVSWLGAHWAASPNQGTASASQGTVNSKISLILIGCLLIPCLGTTTGCSSKDFQASIAVSSQVATNAAQIIAPVNPKAAEILTAVGKGIADAGAAYQDYETADASVKDSKGAALRATLSAMQGNLATVLADVRIKNPEKLQYISIGVAVVNTTVVLILNQLNKSPAETSSSVTAQSVSQSQLPVLAVKSSADLKKVWNNACKQGYPQAQLK